MAIDFLRVLNDTNSIKNDITGEIIITSPIFQTEGQYQINSSCKISSNCNTVIISDSFEISSSSVSLSGLSFQAPIIIRNVNDISISHCTIKQSKMSDGAISIYKSENVSLSHITITETNKTPGLFIYQNSVVTAKNISIHDLTETLIAINNKSSLIIKDSDLHHSNSNAFYLAGQSYIEICNCSISYTNYPALYAKDSRCIVKNNTFQNTNENAISLHASNDFLIEKNIISLVNDTGIRVADESKGTISGNTIHDVDGNGIYCHNSDIKIDNNEIYDLTYPAIAITSRSKASLDGNRVSNIKYSGICVRGAIEVKIESSEINNVNDSGISVSDTKYCIIENNRITNCNINSIEAYNQSNVYIKNNVISHIGKQAFLVYTSGYMKVENNKINDVKDEMVKLIYKGSGDFINNTISECSKQNDCQTSSFYYFEGNGDFTNVTNDPTKLQHNSNSIIFDDHYVDNDDLCLKCNKRKRDCYLLDCGHKAYCCECAEMSLKNHENCPLCRFPIVKVSSGFGVNNDDMCIICCDNKADSIILPCGHMGVCSCCLESWFDSKQSCPICRVEPSVYKQISQDI